MRKVLSFGLVFLLCFSGCAAQPKSSGEITKITGMNVVIAPQFDAAGLSSTAGHGLGKKNPAEP